MKVISPSKPTGLLKVAFILPRYLYCWHPGWVLGHRCLIITHVGRKTGCRRQTVLEVVHYDPVTQECIVMSGYGAHSDWYRNIQVQPATEVQVGHQRYTPRQRMLSSQETLAILEEYQRHHPCCFVSSCISWDMPMMAHLKVFVSSARSYGGSRSVHKV